MPTKTAIVVRKDLDLPVGKWMAQAVHAVLRSASKDSLIIDEYEDDCTDEKTAPICVVLEVESEKDLFVLQDLCLNNNVICALQRDAGHNFIKPQTITCLAIGPDEAYWVSKVTENLKLFRG